MAPINRGWVTALWDRYTGWSNGLPSEMNSYSVEIIHIPMSDGIKLEADLYQPILAGKSKPAGTLLIRGPYGRHPGLSRGFARVWVARGYQALYVSDRGTFGSEGTFRPVQDCVNDGRDILAWMRAQKWYTGSFATLGASYMAWESWALIEGAGGEGLSDMKVALVNTGTTDFVKSTWGTGAFQPSMIFWAAFMEKMLKPGWEPMILWVTKLVRALPKVYEALPLKTAVDDYFQGKTPAWLDQIMTPGPLDDPKWDSLRAPNVLNHAKIPILLTTGWNDIWSSQVFEQYAQLSKHNPDVSLTVGPWTHLGAGGGNTMKETWTALQEKLAKRAVSEDLKRAAPLHIYVTGANEWRDFQTWPGQTKLRPFYLAGNGNLSSERSSDDSERASEFDYGPESPTPATGMAVQFAIAPDNVDTALAARSDVLTFTTSPLESSFEVFGQPAVDLYHETNTPYADLLVRLSDVDAKGVSRNVSEVYIRLDEKREPGPLRLKLIDCGHCFVKGNCVRLLIAGGAHPTYLRNFGTGEPPATATRMVKVKHTVLHHAAAVSSISLPVSA